MYLTYTLTVQVDHGCVECETKIAAGVPKLFCSFRCVSDHVDRLFKPHALGVVKAIFLHNYVKNVIFDILPRLNGARSKALLNDYLIQNPECAIHEVLCEFISDKS